MSTKQEQEPEARAPDASLRKRIREVLAKAGGPTTEKDLLKRLRVKGDARTKAKDTIEALLSRGELARTRAGRIGLAERMDLVRGRLECKRGGFGFVILEVLGQPDVYVAGPDLADALHGDRVLVHVDRKGIGGRPEGRIVEVLERRTTRVVGRLEIDAAGTRVVPFDPKFLYEVFLPSADLQGAEAGDMVVAELTRFPAPFRAPLGRIVEALGSVEEPGVDVRVVVEKHGLPVDFSPEVIAEAEAIATEVSAEAIASREDFRDRPIVTIDGETARDFDDAVEVEVLDTGAYRLGVHIADVSHYVPEGSALDASAFDRGTSVYFPDRAIPMLPERLSNGICSLNPEVDRLVQSVYIDVSPNGKIVGSRFADGVIRSAARMTYTNVRRILVDRDPAVRERYEALLPQFDNMFALFQILRARREARGSIDFDMPEAEVVLDEKGQVVDIQKAERNVAHRIIEEFMLLANEVVARSFAERESSSLYRVHEPPDEARVERFEELILGLGHRLRSASEALHPRAFQRLLRRVAGTNEERLVAYAMLRTMKQAVYSDENGGHYALASKFYTHFTSPIRRYPDLVVHRLLRRLRRSGKPESIALASVAEHASFTERRAEEAERELVDWKKLRFMADRVGESYPGFVSGVTSYGLYVELEDFFIEGLVHISTLVDDYYHYSEQAHSLRGESTGRMFRLGDPVEVRVARVDRQNRQIELALEDMKMAPGRGRQAKGKGKAGGQKKTKTKAKGASRAKRNKPARRASKPRRRR